MTSQDHRMALPQGTRVQDFEFHRVLGHGGFGITYLGWNVTLDIAVAIKEYLPADLAVREQDLSVVPRSSGDEADFQWGLDRFLDEARVMARFKHTNIIQVQHFFQAHGTAYIVMEYAEGETLADLLKRRGTLTEDELKTILLPLLAGLEDVHQAGILHRDIKPGNIMLRALDGSPVLVDFGAARQAVGARSRSMTAIVTPGYAPIEQYSTRGHQGSWTDVYALGGVCYRALTGELPAEATDRVRSDPLIPIAEAGRGKAGDAFLQAIDWALRVDEGERPQGVGEWRAALLGEGEVPAPASAVSSDLASRSEASSAGRSGVFRWAMGLALALLVGAGGWWGWQMYGDGDNFLAVVKSVIPSLEETVPGTPTEVEPVTPGKAGAETSEEVETRILEEIRTETQVASSEEPPPVNTAESEPSASMEEESEPEPDTPTSEVDRLLAAAEADLAARRLTSPVGNNAWERYQRVLTLAPAHPEAMAGMEQVLGSYLELFGAAVEQEDFDRAAGYLERIRGLHPDSPALAEGEQRLAMARQAQADRLAENQAFREHLDSFEEALKQEDFDKAAGHLARIRELRPDAPGLAEGEQRLEAAKQAQAERLAELARQRQAEAAREAELFEGALRQGDLDGAASHLERARELHPAAPVLVEGEQRLAEARQAAELERQRLESEARVREAVGKMVSIPGGTFRMGDLSGEGYDSEKPVHTVIVSPFKLGKYEVTFAQWDACVADGGCGGYRPDDEGWGRGNRPVINVSWDDAQTFISWLNVRTGGHYRLPTEAEWEYAARAGSTTKYSWGDDIGRNRANCDGCGSQWDAKQTAPVGAFAANAWGLHDMHGNLLEWTQDCSNDSYRGAPSDGSAWTGGGDCSWRVIRGGSWLYLPRYLRSALRFRNARSNRDDNLGFRLAQDE